MPEVPPINAKSQGLHIGIDARSIFTGGGGDRTYFRNLIGTMARLYPEHRWTLYAEAYDADRDSLACENVTIAKPMPAKVAALWNVTQLAPALRRDRVDVLHSQYMLPPFGPVSCPMVVTIHDATFRLFPEWFPKHANRVMNTLIPIAARRAKRIITVSESASRDLQECLSVPREKIVVTYNGVGEQFFPRTAEQITVARARYELPERYLFGVGILRRRKNTAIVLRAMDILAERGEWPDGAVLALTGAWSGDRDAEAVYQSSERLKPLVRTLGFVGDEYLPALYSGAAGSVYPSLYEGFGIPAIEAMACGSPVAASNTSSLPEVVGDAGFQLPTDDAEAWASALRVLLSETSERDTLVKKGIARAHEFTWERAARQTMAVYESVAKRRAISR